MYQYRFDPSSWNWNKFGSGSRNLGDLLYLMNGESAFKLSALHPPPEYMLQQESHKGGLETSGKMPARNPADKVHYIVQGLATYPFSDFGTGRSPPKKWVLSGRVNSIIDACWHSSLPSSPFRAYPKENPVLLGREYLNWLFAVQEFLFRQFIPSIHSVFFDLRFQLFCVSALTYCSMELRSKIWKKQAFPRLYHPVNSVPLNPSFMATYLSG